MARELCGCKVAIYRSLPLRWLSMLLRVAARPPGLALSSAMETFLS